MLNSFSSRRFGNNPFISKDVSAVRTKSNGWNILTDEGVIPETSRTKWIEHFLMNFSYIQYNWPYLLCTEITKRHLNNRIRQHCGVKTSTVTPSIFYVFNISLSCVACERRRIFSVTVREKIRLRSQAMSCENSIPNFIGNLWRVHLLGNYLKGFFFLRNLEKNVIFRICFI